VSASLFKNPEFFGKKVVPVEKYVGKADCGWHQWELQFSESMTAVEIWISWAGGVAQVVERLLSK
jgi:hypothetical protein